MSTGRAPLRGDELKDAVGRLATELHEKINGPQGGVGTFSDHTFLEAIARLAELGEAQPWEDSVENIRNGVERIQQTLLRLRLLVTRRAQGRLVDFEERIQGQPRGVHGDSDLRDLDMVMSQGAFECMHWKGRPLFKTAYDLSIYAMMLWNLKPQTIIEVGSGAGASAVWFADHAAVFGSGTKVYSMDLKVPDVQHEGVTFVEGDCTWIGTVFKEDFLKSAPHPWMIIEDAHVNVRGVLSYFHQYIATGDYVVVEDSAGKQADIGRFLTEQPGCYKVDTHYTDFFGRNVTSARDSILVRV